MRPQGIPEDYIKMKAFPFSLDGAVKDWLLCATCPHHQINEQLLIQYFYKGLMMMDRNMIDAASGGALMDKTAATTRHLISNMASNTQQLETRGAVSSREVNEVGAVDNLRLEDQLTELTPLVRQLAISQHQHIPPVKMYGICTFMEHPIDMCPTLQETESDNTEIVRAIGRNQYGRQPYQTRQFDDQQFRRPQQYRSSPSQGQYVVLRFGSTPNMPTLNHNYYQQPGPRYLAPLFQQ
ncbi:hypothetical protein CR513_46463, partial [Mucuna pruriens]